MPNHSALIINMEEEYASEGLMEPEILIIY